MISSPDLVVVPARLGLPTSALSKYAEQLHESTGLSVMSVNPTLPHSSCGFDGESGWDYDAVESSVVDQIGNERVAGVVIFNEGNDEHRGHTVLNAVGYVARVLDGIIDLRDTDEVLQHRVFTSHGLPRLAPGSQRVPCDSNEYPRPLISLRSRNATPLGAFIRQHLVAEKEEQ